MKLSTLFTALAMFLGMLSQSCSSSKLPKTVSLEAYVPPVKDQKHYVNDIGWSTTYYAMSTQENVKNKRAVSAGKIRKKTERNFYVKEADEYFAFSPFYTFNQIAEDPHSGGTIEAFLSKLKIEGTPRFADFGSPMETPAPKLRAYFKKHKKLWKIKKINRQKVDRDGDVLGLITDIKQKLHKGIPVVFTIYASEEFKALNGKTSYTNYSFSPVDMKHTITLVGYNENETVPYFRAVNSWGEKWGDQGYVNIPYDVLIAIAIDYISFKS